MVTPSVLSQKTQRIALGDSSATCECNYDIQWNPQLMFSLHLIPNFNNPKSNNPSVKFPTFKTFISLVLKFTVPQRDLK